MPDKLKPCPFCGGTIFILKLGRGKDKNGEEIFQTYCKQCGTETPYFFTKKDAIDAWHE